MFSAISFGVFCRSAPSTSAIIRSRNVSPGFEVIVTSIQSDSTLVPPVTADRSPPASRMTGADSPVMADSSTLATPLMISPSPGIIWPASTRTMSPARSVLAFTVSRWPPGSRRTAVVSVLALRSVAACALPRPSAIASAKLAKSTVNQSQNATCPVKSGSPVPLASSWTKTIVVMRLPTSTMNITGFLIWTRGSSLTNESAIACRTICGSQIEVVRARSAMVCVLVTDVCAGAPSASSSARFSSSTLTRARPRNPKVGGSVCA